MERSVIPTSSEPVTLLRLAYDGANVSEGDEQQVLSHLVASMHRLGLPQVSLAVTLDDSSIRVAIRDTVTAAAIMHAVEHGHLLPPPHPGRARSGLTWHMGVGIATTIVCVAVLLAAVVVRARRETQEHSLRAQQKRGSTCPPDTLQKRGSLLA